MARRGPISSDSLACRSHIERATYQMKGKNVSVDIVIPVYNAAAFLDETLRSVLSQTVEPARIVVVDDGSSDGSVEIARGHAGVKVVIQSNAGDSAARNTGLAHCGSDFVLFLDHDDVLHPQAVARHIAAFEAHPEVAIVFGSNDLIDDTGRKIGNNPQEPRTFSVRDVVLGTTPSFSQCLYRRVDLERIGGFDATAGSCADHDLNLRLLGAKGTGICHGEMVMSYRQHLGQQTKSPTRLYLKHLEVLTRHLGPGGMLADRDLLRTAKRHWQTYYGQFMLPEVVRMLHKGQFAGALHALASFSSALPWSGLGFLHFLRRKIASVR